MALLAKGQQGVQDRALQNLEDGWLGEKVTDILVRLSPGNTYYYVRWSNTAG